MPVTSPQTCADEGFNYCKFAKTLVAIPALPITGWIAWLATAFLHCAVLQLLAAAGSIAGVIYLAIWIDRIPLLQKKICQPRMKPSAPVDKEGL